jgi:hypothetical protein
LSDGGAVVLSTQSDRGGPSAQAALRPAPGAFFLVGADGAVETIGPLPGVEGVVHSPLALRAH